MSTVKTVNIQHPNSSNINMVLGADGSVSGALPSPNRNKIINGSMAVWQRGTLFTSLDAYSADRWKFTQLSPTGACTLSRQTGPTRFQYCLRMQRNSGQTATGGIFIGYGAESTDIIPLQGQTATFSFYARAGANFSSLSSALGFFVTQGTGSGTQAFAAGTGETTAISGTATLTTSWQRFTFTGSFASNASEMRINMYYTPIGTAGANDYFEITGVQLEQGNSPTEFEFKSYAQELRECQRYYELVGLAIATSSPAVAANILACSSFAVRKRITAGIPTRITNDYFYGAAGMATTTSSYIVTAEAIVAYRTSNGAAGQTQFSELVAVSAEL
jgi:hypothetical protein